MKHTEGPWQVGGSFEDDYEPRHVEINGADGVKLIAKAYYGKTDEERATNAHLIAAAPELLTYLKTMLHLFDRGLKPGTVGRQTCDIATAIIIKAEGT